MKTFAKMSALLVAVAVAAGSANALDVTPTGDGAELAENILGSGIEISGVSYTGGDLTAGTFTGGNAAGLDIDEGIILTTGTATDAVGPNTSDSTSTDNGLAGDSDLDALIPGYTTFDATILSFDFTTDSGDLFFRFVFASEEYNEWVTSQYNDVFGFFVDGVNIALIPGTLTPIAVDTLNGGYPFGDANASHPELYHNNSLSDPGPPTFDLQYDGFTTVLQAKALDLGDGTHHIKLAITDAGDSIYDSAVFIEANSFDDFDDIPEPGTAILIGSALAGLLCVIKHRK